LRTSKRPHSTLIDSTPAKGAGVSPGSLYQFFPNKEAIAQAYAAEAVTQLHRVYDALLAFNRAYPGYLALALASTLSAPLAAALADLQGGVSGRIEAVLAAFWLRGTPAQRRLPGLVAQRRAIVGELKAGLYRYWAPLVAAPPA